MTYQIDIPAEVYMNWSCVNEYLENARTDLLFSPTAKDWFNDRHPEILEVSDLIHTIDDYFFRTFTFKSEAHYTWFLLQQ